MVMAIVGVDIKVEELEKMLQVVEIGRGQDRMAWHEMKE